MSVSVIPHHTQQQNVAVQKNYKSMLSQSSPEIRSIRGNSDAAICFNVNFEPRIGDGYYQLSNSISLSTLPHDVKESEQQETANGPDAPLETNRNVEYMRSEKLTTECLSPSDTLFDMLVAPRAFQV